MIPEYYLSQQSRMRTTRKHHTYHRIRRHRKQRRATLRRRQRGGVSDNPTSATIQGIAYNPRKTVVVTPFFTGSVSEFTERLNQEDTGT